MKNVKWLFLALITLNSLMAQASENRCPANAQKILVIDLKSGWWQGDGGDTHEIIEKHIKDHCSNVTLEYRHSTYGGYGSGGFGFGFGGFGSKEDLNQMDPLASGPNQFPSEPFENYNQVWLLSGGEADGVDLRTNSREFQRYIEGIKRTNSNLFIGTGFGNVYHANALTTALGLGAIVATDLETHTYPQASSGSHALTELTTGMLASNEILFENVTRLPDTVKVGEYDVTPDWVIAAENVKALAVNGQGKIVIARLELANRQIIVDTNLGRTYLIRHEDHNVEQYLLNLVLALEK